MNNMQILLLFFLMQSNYGKMPSSAAAPADVHRQRPRNSSHQRLSFHDASDTILSLRQAVDTLERMNKMAGSMQNMPAALNAVIHSLPTMLESTLSQSNTPQSSLPVPDNYGIRSDDFSDIIGNSYADIDSHSDSNAPKLPDLNRLMQTVAPLLQSLTSQGSRP